MIQGLLLEEGIPSVLRRTSGFDVPDFLAVGPRDVMVPQAGAEPASFSTRRIGLQQGAVARPSALKLIAAIALGGGCAALIAWGLQGGV